MKQWAQDVIDREVSRSTTFRSVRATKIDDAELRFSARFFYFGTLVLHTKAISSIQKFQQSDTPLISRRVGEEVTKQFWLAGIAIAVGFGLLIADIGLPLLLAVAVAALGYIPASRGIWLKRLLREKVHEKKDFFLEVIMNSGRRHRFFTNSEKQTDALARLFMNIIASDDQGTIYRYDQSTNNIVVDHSDHSINATQIGEGLTLNMDVETDEQEKTD